MVLTSLLNPDIVLPPKTFREWQELPEAPPGRMPSALGLYILEGAKGLMDLSWEQRVPLIQQDDIDKNPLYNQYPYQDDYDDEEEDMEIDDQMLGNAGMPVRLLQLAPDIRTIMPQLVMPPTLNSLRVHPGVSLQTQMPLWNLTP